MAPTYRVLSFDCLGSTNDEAMAHLKAGDPGDLFIVARRQTGGRGRQGRVWTSPQGNLYASLALRDPAPLALAPQLGFVAGVALARTLRARLGDDSRLKIKWPNDAVFAGAKMAGILLESSSLPHGGLGCVIGFGVNCISHPEGLAYATTHLGAVGAEDTDPDTLVTELGRCFGVELQRWNHGAGFADVRSAWLDMAAGLGERIEVAMPTRRLAGVFRDLDSQGRLLIETGSGLTSVDAGDVFLPASAPERIT